MNNQQYVDHRNEACLRPMMHRMQAVLTEIILAKIVLLHQLP